MNDQVLTPKQVPEELTEKWLNGSEQWHNPMEAAVRHAELKTAKQAASNKAWTFGTLAIGIVIGAALVVAGLLGIALGLAAGWVVIAALYTVAAVRLTLRAHMAYQEASMVQKAACGAIRVVHSPDDPTPAKLDAQGRIVEEPEQAATGT